MEKILLIFTLILMFAFLFFLGIKMDGSMNGSPNNELSNIKYETSPILHIPQNLSSKSKPNDTIKKRIRNDNMNKDYITPFNVYIEQNVIERTHVTDFTGNKTSNEFNYETKTPVTIKNEKPKYKYENVGLLLYNKQVEERNANKNTTQFRTNGLPILPHINRRSQSRKQKNETSTIKYNQKNKAQNKQVYNTVDRKRTQNSSLITKQEKDKDNMSDWRYKQVEGRPGFYGYLFNK